MTIRKGSFYAPLVLRVMLGSLFIAHLYWKFAILPGGLAHCKALPGIMFF
jgi:hypothetical protein